MNEVKQFFIDYKLFKDFCKNISKKEEEIKKCKDKNIKKNLKNELSDLLDNKKIYDSKLKEFYKFIHAYIE